MSGPSAAQRVVERLGWGTAIDREGFARAVAEAIEAGRGFATGKLCNSERGYLMAPIVNSGRFTATQRRAYELKLAASALEHSGVFPPRGEPFRRFCEQYARAVGELDAIGIDHLAVDESVRVLAFHRPCGRLVDYLDQEPDRSWPRADERRCWLGTLRDRRLLLISSHAGVLAERANRETFEAVWGRIGKSWFEPASVEALEFPYGFSPATWERYADSLELAEEIAERAAARDFDVALIAAGGIGIPLAARLRKSGKVAISLGGHLQPLFGVVGDRWLRDPRWRERYINETWIRMPEDYRVPDDARFAEDYQ